MRFHIHSVFLITLSLIFGFSLGVFPIPAEAQVVPSINIYDNAFSANWRDASYGSTVEFGNNIKIISGQWGVLSVLSGNYNAPINIDPTGYASLQFSANGGTTGATVNIFFQNDTVYGPAVSRTLSANTWSPINVPMSELNPQSLPMNRFTIQLITPAGTTWYVDDLKLVAATQTSTVPTITSLQPASGVVGASVTITGTGFTPTGNKIKFGGQGSENNPNYNLNSSDGRTLIFPVPGSNYFACWDSVPACAIAAYSTPPGIYQVSVINSNGTSNSMPFTVNAFNITPSPVITSQPASKTVPAGSTATFSVTATGTNPLSYQWQSNYKFRAIGAQSRVTTFADIPGATSSSYTTSPVDMSLSGIKYRVIVTNSAGSVTSNEATLTVNPVSNNTYTVIYDDARANGWLDASWSTQNDWANTENPYQGAKALKSTLTGYGGVQISTTTNAIPKINVQALKFAVRSATAGSVNVRLFGVGGASQSTIVNKTYPANTWTEITIPISDFGFTGTSIGQFFLQKGESEDRVIYFDDIKFVTIFVAFSAPTITTHPVSQTVSANSSATFSVAATGTEPLSYQWKKGTTNVGTNSSTLTLNNVQAADAGSYTVTVTNSVGTATSIPATLTVNPLVNNLPTGTFTSSPTSLPVGGGSATLSWASANATSASISRIGNVAISGTRSISISTTTTYTLTLTNANGSTNIPLTVRVGSNSSSIERVVLYHSAWAPNKLPSNGFDWRGITDLIWFGSELRRNIPFPYVSFRNDGGEAYLRALIADAHANGVRVILDIVDIPTTLYSEITVTDESTQAWVNAIMNQYIIPYGFDGVDPDWEMAPQPAEGFTRLGRIFRQALDAYDPPVGSRGVLTAAIGREYSAGQPVEAINQYFDFVNIMSYDANGWYGQTTAFHEPLKNVISNWPTIHPNDAALNIERDMQTWIDHGLIKSKAAVGLALYPHIFHEYTNPVFQPGQPMYGQAVCAHPLGWCEGLDNYYSFYVNNIANGRLTENYDALAAMAWVGSATVPGPCQVNTPCEHWQDRDPLPAICDQTPRPADRNICQINRLAGYISPPGIYANYNSPQSFAQKIGWLKDNGYTSIMLFANEHAYFDTPISIGNQPASRTPLLDAVRIALGSSTSPTRPPTPTPPPATPTIPSTPPVTPTPPPVSLSTYDFGSVTVKLGFRGEGCRAWQQFFNDKINAGLDVDGICGPKTIAIAKSWQASVGLTADGALGTMSRAKASSNN